MKRLLYLFQNRIQYHSSYDCEISLGNTSTGRLNIEYLDGRLEKIEMLKNQGYAVWPVVLLGNDLFGKIAYEILKQTDCDLRYVKVIEERTPFEFFLSCGEGSLYYEIGNHSKSIEYWKAYYKDVIEKDESNKIITEKLFDTLDLGETGSALRVKDYVLLGAAEEVQRLADDLTA